MKIGFNQESNKESSKYKVVDNVRTSNIKTFLQRVISKLVRRSAYD